MQIQNRLLPNPSKAVTRHFGNMAPRLASFSLIHRYGQLAMHHHTTLTGMVVNRPIKKLKDFSHWSMPEQKVGYIKCKKHDFL